MSTKLAGINRFFTFLIAVALIALGIFPLLLHLNVPQARTISDSISAEAIGSAPDQPWWPWALGLTTVIAAVLGIWVILANLNSRRFSRMESSASTDNGSIGLSIDSIADAVTEDLETIPEVTSVSSTVAYDRSRPTVRYIIKADNTVSVPELKTRVERAESYFRDAVEDVDVDTVYQLKLSPIRN